MRFLIVVIVATASASASARTCNAGKACGNSCIAWEDECTRAVMNAPPTCYVGKPCGDTCIHETYQCHVAPDAKKPDAPAPAMMDNGTALCVYGCGGCVSLAGLLGFLLLQLALGS